LCGGWAAAVGWALGWLTVHGDSLGGTGIKGMFLGMLIALALGMGDGLWVFSLRPFWRLAPRGRVCRVVVRLRGLFGGFFGRLLFDWKNLAILLILGWVLTGLMVGVSIGTYDLVLGWVREEDLRGAARKVVRGVLGGTVGGLLGGFLDWTMGDAW